MHNHLWFLLGLRAPRLVQALRDVPERVVQSEAAGQDGKTLSSPPPQG